MAYTTEAKVEAELQTDITSTSTPNSTQVATFITEAEALIDRRTGTTFGTAAFSDEILNLNEDNTFTSSLITQGNGYSRNDYWFGGVGSKDTFYLPYWPIVSLSDLSTNSAGATEADSWTTRTEQTGSGGDFTLNYSTGKIKFLQNYPRYGDRSVKASGVYGFSSVPDVVSELATKLVAHRILEGKAKKSQATSVDSIQLEGISIRKNIGQTSQFLVQIKNRIDELWEAVGTMISEAV